MIIQKTITGSLLDLTKNQGEAEIINKFVADPFIKELIKIWEEGVQNNRPSLPMTIIGGAVIDIMEGRTPKDYDIIHGSNGENKLLEKAGYEFKYKTKFATTYEGKNVIQLINRPTTTFDYTISLSSLSLVRRIRYCNEDKKYDLFDINATLTYDEVSFNRKVLIPQSFTDVSMVLNSLKRVPHYIKKGYYIPDNTYLSLLSVLADHKNIIQSHPIHS